MKKIDVRYGGSFGYDSRGGKWFQLRLEDALSCELVAEVRFQADDFFQLHSSLHDVNTITAEISEHPERFGKKMVTEMHRMNRAGDVEIEERCAEMAADGWETIQVGKHNYGRSITVRKWVEDED